MGHVKKCPSESLLIRLNRGEISGDEIDRLFDHLDRCARCQDYFLQQESSEDAFTRLLDAISEEDLREAQYGIELELLHQTAVSVIDELPKRHVLSDREPFLEPPTTLHGYEITRLIDIGGMGEVYEAYDKHLRRRAAIKVIRRVRQQDPVIYQQFIDEMRTAGQVQHPNLVFTYHVIQEKGTFYLIQEYLEGESIRQLVQRGGIRSAAEIVDILLGTCRGLQKLHEEGFVHRDVTPRNIMRLTDGTIKVIDFGLALATKDGKKVPRCRAGTPGYMSPEQQRGDASIDHRSDIYSAGRVLKFLLSGLPRESQTRAEQSLRQSLRSLCDRMTQDAPERRFQSITDVIQQLEALKSGAEVILDANASGNEPLSDDAGTNKSSDRGAAERDTSDVDPTAVTRLDQAPESRGFSDAFNRSASTVATSASPVSLPLRRRHKARHARQAKWFWSIVAPVILLLGGLVSYGAWQLVFKTDREATISVVNARPDDVIEIKSDDGQVRRVELGAEARFTVAPGTYELRLADPQGRRIDPGNIRVQPSGQLVVRIKDVEADRGKSVLDASEADASSTGKSNTAPSSPPKTDGVAMSAGVDKPPGRKPPKRTQPADIDAAGLPRLKVPFSPAEILVARQQWSEYLGLPETITVNLPNDDTFGLQFVLIPPGSFEMGVPDALVEMKKDDPKWYQASRPAHLVRITRPFYISRYEVTQKQFREIFGGGLTPVTGDGTRYPATQVHWQAWGEFCERLSDRGTGLPRGARIRFPTEAEWEYACRAGTETWYWMGNTIGPDEASMRHQGRPMQLEPIDSFQPNPFGLYNVHGNVMEWCQDWYSDTYFAASPVDDPQGPKEGTRKVLRGGGWSNPPFAVTSYWRQSYPPDIRTSTSGLRPVIELPSGP